MGIDLKKKTPLETACFEILGNDSEQYYNILSRLLILNPHFIRKNDKRLSAKITSLLFTEEIKDKVHLICLFIENDKMKSDFSQSEIELAKLLLETDPELSTTNKIISHLKELPDPNYSEIMRKVPIKHSQKLYYHGESASRRRI